MLVKEIMRTDFYVFSIDNTLGEVCEMMDRHKLYGAPVVDQQNVIQGIFTRPHLIRAFMEKKDHATPIKQLMQTSVTTLHPNSAVSDAIKQFINTSYQNYPVKDDDGKLVGLVLQSDLLQVGAQEFFKIFGTFNLNHLGNALIGIDSQGYVRSVSNTARNILGPVANSIVDKHVLETIPLMESLGKELLSDAKKSKELSRQLNIAQKRIEYYRIELENIRGKYTFNEIIGMSAQMKKMRNLAAKAAKTSSTILIHGESGTGKELIAHAIHNASPRCHEPFIKVNCAAIPEQLMESELFGYNEGAFTGAAKGGKPGKFELADGGTIFLDEIGDMQLSVQAKLLRVLQEYEFERVGGTKTINVDVRVIAATNQDLKQLVSQGTFRRDLYYRLNVVEIETPPLRERTEDIDYLTDYLIEKIADRIGIQVNGIAEEARAYLRSYDFPGNVRELENILERAINLLNEDEHMIGKEHLQLFNKSSMTEPIIETPVNVFKPLSQVVSSAEKKAIMEALTFTQGNRNEAARLLKIHRSLLYKKLSKHNIS